MKLIASLTFIIALGVRALAANPYETLIFQQDALNVTYGYYVPVPTGNAFWIWDSSLKESRLVDCDPSAFAIAGGLVTVDYAGLLNKPTLGSAASQSAGSFAAASHTHAQSDITGLTAALAGKFANPSGTTAQYVRGDGSIATINFLTAEVDGSTTNEIELPSMSGQSGKILSNNGSSATWTTAAAGTVTSITAGTGLNGGTITGSGTISMPNTGTAGIYGSVTTDAQGRVTAGKRTETYSVTTNASGVASVTFSTAYSAAPNIQAQATNFSSDNQFIRVTSITTTGFSIICRLRTDIAGLLPSFSNINGATVDVLITEKA